MQQNITLTNSALLKYTLFSLVFAAVALLTIILPAEYNIDPTGIGHKLGLTVFNNDNSEAATPKSADKQIGIAETIKVIVPAGAGVEYKFDMTQYQKIEYQWTTDGTSLFFDLHGDPKGDTTGYFESYAKATLNGMKGSFTVPFSGAHGWYWKNSSNSPVTIQLIVKGDYASRGLK
jgi:hypothetical protein